LTFSPTISPFLLINIFFLGFFFPVFSSISLGSSSTSNSSPSLVIYFFFLFLSSVIIFSISIIFPSFVFIFLGSSVISSSSASSLSSGFSDISFVLGFFLLFFGFFYL
jgi:hypothetical protein